jgi:hypothetical protein
VARLEQTSRNCGVELVQEKPKSQCEAGNQGCDEYVLSHAAQPHPTVIHGYWIRSHDRKVIASKFDRDRTKKSARSFDRADGVTAFNPDALT